MAGAVNAVVQLASEAGFRELADTVRAEAQRWRLKETTVVVAAEPNRGKSSLLNALLDTDVLPVGAELATTATHVLVGYGPEPAARVHLDGRDQPLEVPVDSVGEWVVQRGPGGGSVQAVELRLHHPLLQTGLVVTDTPGVGGLDAAHGRITLAALRQADAVVFVLDAGAPLSEPELTFLAEATDRIESVIFCVTKIDQFRGWRTVIDDDRALIAARAPRFAAAPVLPVSARLAVLARAGGAVDAELLQESGVPALEGALLHGVVRRVALVRLGNLLRIAASTLDAVAGPIRTTIASATDPGDAKAAAERDQQALEELRDVSDRLTVAMTDRFNALRDQVHNELTRALRDVARGFESGTGPPEGSANVPIEQQVVAEVRAVDARLHELLEVEAGAIAADARTAFGDPTFVMEPVLERPLPLEASATGVSETPAAPPDPASRARIGSALASTGMGATMAVRFAADMPLLGALLGAGAALGAAATFMSLRATNRQRAAHAVKRQLSELLEELRAEATPRLRQRVLTIQRAMEAEVRGYVRRRARELQAAAAENAQLANADAAARQQARVAAEQRLAQLGHQQATIAALITEVHQRSTLS